MLLAVGIGLLLQIAVTEIEPLIHLFGTIKLDWMEWMQLLALSLTPMIVHELLVAVYYGADKKDTKQDTKQDIEQDTMQRIKQECIMPAEKETAH